MLPFILTGIIQVDLPVLCWIIQRQNLNNINNTQYWQVLKFPWKISSSWCDVSMCINIYPVWRNAILSLVLNVSYHTFEEKIRRVKVKSPHQCIRKHCLLSFSYENIINSFDDSSTASMEWNIRVIVYRKSVKKFESVTGIRSTVLAPWTLTHEKFECHYIDWCFEMSVRWEVQYWTTLNIKINTGTKSHSIYTAVSKWWSLIIQALIILNLKKIYTYVRSTCKFKYLFCVRIIRFDVRVVYLNYKYILLKNNIKHTLTYIFIVECPPFFSYKKISVIVIVNIHFLRTSTDKNIYCVS